MANKCKFNEGWAGICNKDIPENEKFCKEHKNIKCSSCGKEATRLCSETMQFVCGAPLCDDCEHTIRDNGYNSGGELPKGLKGHCKKSEQVYKPWFMKNENEWIQTDGSLNTLQYGRKVNKTTWEYVELAGKYASIKQAEDDKNNWCGVEINLLEYTELQIKEAISSFGYLLVNCDFEAKEFKIAQEGTNDDFDIENSIMLICECISEYEYY